MFPSPFLNPPFFLENKMQQVIINREPTTLHASDMQPGDVYKVRWGGQKLGQAIYLKTTNGAVRLAASRAQAAGTDAFHSSEEVVLVDRLVADFNG
jgi:hypothetical protein